MGAELMCGLGRGDAVLLRCGPLRARAARPLRGRCCPVRLGRSGFVGLLRGLLVPSGSADLGSAAVVSSLHVPSGAGVFAWCFASVVARPLRGRHCPGQLPWLVVGGGWPLGVVGLGWCRGGPGSGRRGRVVAAVTVSSLLVPSGAGFCLVLRIRCCPSTTWPSLPRSASLARGRGWLAAWRRGVGLVPWWPWVGSAGPGRGGCHRLVVARPLRGRGFAWCSASVVARPLRGRYHPGRLPWLVVGGRCPWGVGGFGRCAGVLALLGLGGGCCGVHVERRLEFLGGRGVSPVLGSPSGWGLFCLVVPRFRLGEHETRTRRPAQTGAPGKTAGRASSRALGVSSGSVFGPEERAGAVRGCETRHGHRSLGAAAGTTAPDRESGDADPGGNGHVVDGQQRMRSTKQRPRPRRGRATTRPRPPPRPGPAERTQGHTANSPTAPRQADNGPRPRAREAVQGSDGHVVDGQQRMRSTKQNPGPGGDVQRRDGGHPPRPGPAERTQGRTAPAQRHDAKPPTAPQP
ncbi:hypothetical protein ABIA38_002111 [Embleya sp. AB8]